MSTVYRVILTKSAKQDIKRIADYLIIELQASYSVRRIFRLIMGRIYSLKLFPETGTIIKKDPGGQHYRFIHASKYRVYYRVDKKNKTIVVVHVLHHLQDTPHDLE